jgi:hypothetical protein
MLSLKQFDVELHRLQEEDLELVRSWRNEAYISNQMIYRAFISEEMQRNWFQTN